MKPRFSLGLLGPVEIIVVLLILSPPWSLGCSYAGLCASKEQTPGSLHLLFLRHFLTWVFMGLHPFSFQRSTPQGSPPPLPSPETLHTPPLPYFHHDADAPFIPTLAYCFSTTGMGAPWRVVERTELRVLFSTGARFVPGECKSLKNKSNRK